ncbi:Biotin carboxylase [Streptomyces sp. yr375]|uniref:ATP-grasp domain-containing protein n=1 Tax=Streptomyces sp. yr375 TaxID=1761906 RepID=UPI0008AB8BA1|nr:ATP-grasp domain-containing protein [Streptomyces sp. yr375]SES03037.1 Biotin carboxylase [Streptomyces sp. yr375]
MSTSQPTLLLVGGAIEGAGTECVRLAKEYGFRVVVTETEKQLAAASGVVAQADLAVPLDRQDAEGHIAWARRQAERENITAVYGFREYAVPTTAAVADALGVPGNPPAAARLVRDKYACRERLRSHGFSQPRVVRCSSAEDARDFASRFPGPWVVKPNNAHGSLGVTVVRESAGFAAAVDALPAAHRASFLVEEYQRGTEYSAEGVFIGTDPHVLVLTTKSLLQGTVVEEELTMPAPLPQDVAGRARAAVESALRAVGLTFGAFHVEFWLDGKDIVLGEVHARPAGAPGGNGMWIPMLESVTGVNVHRVVFEQLLGREPDLSRPPRAGGATLRCVFAAPGVVQPGLTAEAVTADPACLGLHVGVRPGDRVPEILNTSHMPAGLVAVGDSPKHASDNAARLAKLLSLTTVPADRA